MASAVITDSRHHFSKRWHVADVKNIAGDNQATLMVHWNFTNFACTCRFYVCLRIRDRDCCSTADGSGSCHAPAPSYFEEIKRCRRQKLQWRWPGNPNGRSKFRNLRLFTFTKLQLMLQQQLRGWWRLPEIAHSHRADVKNTARNYQDRSKFRKYENWCLRDQARCLEKLLFAAVMPSPLTALCTVFFPTITTAFVLTYEK